MLGFLPIAHAFTSTWVSLGPTEALEGANGTLLSPLHEDKAGDRCHFPQLFYLYRSPHPILPELSSLSEDCAWLLLMPLPIQVRFSSLY